MFAVFRLEPKSRILTQARFSLRRNDFFRNSGTNAAEPMLTQISAGAKLVRMVAGKLCEVGWGITRDFFNVGCDGAPAVLFID